MKKYCFVIWVLLINGISFAQSESSFIRVAVPALVLQQSPLFIGTGLIGAAVPMKDPLGFYLNPAQLGYFSQENNLAFLAMPQKSKWLGFTSDYTFLSNGFTAGYNFKSKFDIPLSIGIGFLHNRFSYGMTEYYQPYSTVPEQHEEYTSFNSFSIGVGYNYYLQINLGFAIKSLTSVIHPTYVNGIIQTPEINGTAYDFGVMITAPTAQLFFSDLKFDLNNELHLKPKFDITIGYSLTNKGKELPFFDYSREDPLPRTARLGYTLDFGLFVSNKITSLIAIDYSFTAEAEDMLADRNDNRSIYYQGMFGKINPIKQLIKFKWDQDVVEHRGNILTLFETLYVLSGRYNGAGYNNIRSTGYGFSSGGIFKLLSSLFENQTLRFVTDHFKFEYYDVNNFISTYQNSNTNVQGIAFYIKGITF